MDTVSDRISAEHESTAAELRIMVDKYQKLTAPLVRRLNNLREALSTIEAYGHVKDCVSRRGMECNCLTLVLGTQWNPAQ